MYSAFWVERTKPFRNHIHTSSTFKNEDDSGEKLTWYRLGEDCRPSTAQQVSQFGMDGVVLTWARCNMAASSFLSLQICSLLTSIYHYVSVLDYPPIYLLLLVPHSSAMTLKRVLTIEYQFLRHLYLVTGNYL